MRLAEFDQRPEGADVNYVATPIENAVPNAGGLERASLVGIRSNPAARLRLYCFPFAGGGPAIFRRWLDWIPADVELVRVQLPDRECRGGEHRVPNIKSIADDLLALFCENLDLPYVFFGYSMGALIAYEIAAQLASEGRRSPALFCVAACRPPHFHGRRIWADMSDAALLEHLTGLDSLFATEHRVREMMTERLARVRADLRLCEEYRAGPPTLLSCPIATYCALADPLVSPPEISDWQAYTRASCIGHVLSGGHFFMLTEARDRLARLLARELERLLQCRQSLKPPAVVNKLLNSVS